MFGVRVGLLGLRLVGDPEKLIFSSPLWDFMMDRGGFHKGCSRLVRRGWGYTLKSLRSRLFPPVWVEILIFQSLFLCPVVVLMSRLSSTYMLHVCVYVHIFGPVAQEGFTPDCCDCCPVRVVRKKERLIDGAPLKCTASLSFTTVEAWCACSWCGAAISLPVSRAVSAS